MSEFKGTKGKWTIYHNTQDYNVFCINSKYKWIHHYEEKYNALLISKAPEMLEMLKKVLDVNKHHKFNGHLINEQIEQLIKEATEL